MKKVLCLFIAVIMMLSVVPSAGLGIESRAARTLSDAEITSVVENYLNVVGNRYWNAGYSMDTLKSQVDKGDYYSATTSSQCYCSGSHERANGCTSNVFTGVSRGISQCWGFGDYMEYVIFRTTNGNDWEKKYTVDSNFKFRPGDLIHSTKDSSSQHIMIVYKVVNSRVYIIEANYGGRCKINVRELSNPHSYVNATSSYVMIPPKSLRTDGYMLDLNCYVGNSYRGDISGIATADVYINGTKVANDCTDFYQSVKAGSTYTIKDIRTKSGYTYNGVSTVSGKINGNVNANLSFSKTHYMFDLNGCLDGVSRGNISGIATADVYIDGTKVANDCTDFYQSVKAGSTYTIKDIRTNSGYIYNGSSSISGKVNGDVKVALSLSTKVTYSATNFKMKSGAYTNAYTSSSLATKTGRIYTGDVITIDRIYSNGVVRLSCPWDNGSNKIVYARASELKFKATKYIDAFSAVNGSKVGRVYPNDLVTVIEIYSSGWMKCSCPWNGNGNKTIYIKTSAIY